jgi:hypothetical protein
MIITSLLHECNLTTIPAVQVRGFDKREHDTELTMLSGAVDTQMDTYDDESRRT